jgi:site-specific DNA recombinase
MCSMTGLALLIRKSTRDEAQVSINRQETLGRAWAQDHHPTLPVTVYVDDGISGADMTRPGWQAFCSDVRAGRIGHVWAYEQSRLTRAGVATWDDVAVMLTLAGIGEVHTHRQGAISVREGNRLQGRLLAVIDQEERERARVRVLDAHAQLAAEGRPNGTRVYGYRSARDAAGRPTRVIDEAEAAIIREIAERILRGETLIAIGNDLRRREVPTAKGGKWGNSVLKSVVTKPAVAGLRVHRGATVDGTWPAILPHDRWMAVRAHLANSTRMVIDRTGKARRITVPARAGRRWLLTGGLLLCGQCGHRLVASANSRADGKSSYSCNKITHPDACGGVSTLAEPLEEYVVREMFADVAAFGEAVPRTDDDTAVVAGELADTESRLRVLAEDFGAGMLPEAVYRDAVAIAAARASDLRAKLASVAGPLGELADLEALRAGWEDLPLQRKREVIRVMIDRVVLAKANRHGPRVFDESRVTIFPA